ncbi:MAG: hypothetical protein B7X83_03865 [Polynucleobacter sp. 17-46-58]|jgi:predicted O-linked N-acetylglucosamine transferase (SPINDLY family)|nr:MAG: hypothetical protein B7Y55_02230 [Polynucleobacter sp. 35-46-207]OYZ37197.1 MAG: hypothetical protein B7Y22_03825 [Polynucleobacter sp. 16-46-70]OZA40868.1 MAG: hypothetical protein B7X83_03865 [Polynucleobacter sp. 17-46-58]OZB48580.1 MAG: hypothetical protein B7X60_03625 [Polynucleobacter sp. 39-45-136]HQT21204.1 tetratricopeptide repeat protein [Polynucleobacter sp.]
MSRKQIELLKLAEQYFFKQNYGLAKAVLQKILQGDLNNSRANELLAYIVGNEGDLQGAIRLLEKACSFSSCNPAAYYELGSIYLSRDEDESAIASFEKATQLGFKTFELHFNYGQALAKLGLFSRAFEQFTQAKNQNQSSPELFLNLARLHEYLNESNNALQCYEKAISLDPRYALAWIGGAQLLKKKGDYSAALSALDKVLSFDAFNSQTLYLKGNLLRSMKRYSEAINVYSRCLEIAPDLPFLFGTYVNTKLLICDWSDYDECLERIKQGVLESKEIISPFPLLAMFDDPKLQRLAANIWVKHESENIEPLQDKESYSHQKKIRVGYFSADFGYHPVAFLIAEIFELHNRESFEIYGFSIGPNTGDPMRKRLESAFDHFIDANNLSDAKIAERAKELEIDIAVDLTGFTQDGRTNIFGLRAAPIQVNFLGYPGTLGASYMDYIIADPILIPDDSLDFYAEKVAYLPDSYQPNDRQRLKVESRFSRAKAELPENGFVFCCFNNNFKITPNQFDLWAEILRQVEGSYLWLLEDSSLASNNLRNEILHRGLDAGRLIFAPRVSPNDHLARMSAADLFLDTAPYNAHTTASDALWVGLPVITRMGKSFASRVAASLLCASGLSELAVETDGAYVHLARDLARDPDKLKGLRNRLLANNENLPLFDSIKFTKNLENLYVQMYERAQSGLPPAQI